MYIKRITIHKCIRFPLYGEDTLDLEFNNKVVMIKGRNGSGKSSLFSMLTPLPADKNDFELGGYLTIYITNQGRDYVLTSDFSKKTPSFSFNVDGEELNQAGIISTQRVLVFSHFKLNQALFDLMYGKGIFTDMTLGARKKLFSTLTKLNMDHILKGYAKLNEQLNLNKLMLKNEQKQYKSEESKLMEESELLKTEEDLKRVNSDIDYLLDVRSNLARYFNPESSESSMLDLNELIKQRDNIYKENYTLLTTHPLSRLEKDKETLQMRSVSNKNNLDFCYRELESLTIMEKSMVENELEDEDGLKRKIDELSRKYDDNVKHIKYITQENYLNENVENKFLMLNDRLKDIVRDLPINKVNGEFIYSRTTLNNANDKRQTLASEFDTLVAEEMSIIETAKKIKELNMNVKCPDCNHSWHINDVITLDDSRARIISIRERTTKIKEEISKLDDFIRNCNDYFNDFKHIAYLKKETLDVFKPFWDEVDSRDLVSLSPTTIPTVLSSLLLDIDLVKECISIKKTISLLEERIKLLASFNGDTLVGVRTRINDMNNKIIDLITSNRDIESELGLINKAISLSKVISGINNSINMTKDRVREYNLSYVTSNIFNIIDTEVRDLRIRSTDLSNMVRNQDNIRYGLKGISDKIIDIEENIHVLDITLKELSPKNGIIAKTISSFLNTIISNINNTLKRIWSYKMVLMPIDLEHSDLNYEFKIEVEDRLKVNDITLASKGMKEAINLAFKLVLYKLHGFDNYPLYLDELASNMDEEHTSKMSQLVHSFAYESNFSQVFIISHKENMGFLKDVDEFELS